MDICLRAGSIPEADGMKELKCDGCGLREDSRVPDQKRVIREVKLQVSTDSRSWAESERHEADLCPTCRGTLLHAYFGLPAEGTLAVPAFAQPTALERRRA